MNPIAVIAIIVICVAAFIYFRSAGKHLDRMSNNYEDPDAGSLLSGPLFLYPDDRDLYNVERLRRRLC